MKRIDLSIKTILGVLFVLIWGCSAAFAQIQFKVGQSFSLLTGVQVKIVGHVPPKKDKESTAIGLMLAVESPNIGIAELPRISDMFFAQFWGPSIELQGKKRGTIYIEVPGAKKTTKKMIGKQSVTLIRNLDYERKEQALWVPVGRPIPNWLKASAGKELRLSNGDTVWLEKASKFYSQIIKNKTIGLNIRGNWTSTGTRPALEQIRRLAAEKLQKLRQQHELILVTNFPIPRKDGFHFRPQVKAFVLRKSLDDFWLVQKFQFVQFTGDKSKASMVWYVPSAPFEKMSPELLLEEAKLLQSQFGAKIAENVGLKLSIIMAIWPADKTGARIMRNGTIFQKNQNGKWQLKPASKKN